MVDRGVASRDELRVTLYLAHVVDDHRDAQPLAVVQQVLEHGRLAGAQEAGEHRDGKP
jgi:hypothetical protein